MRWPSIAAVVVAALMVASLACSPAQMALVEVTVSPSSISNMDPVGGSVRVTVTAASGSPATGQVALASTLGELATTSLTLDDEGTARTTIRCVFGLNGACSGQGEVTVTWSGVTGSSPVRFSAPTVRPDGGNDAGSDGGSDGGLDGGGDAGFDAGVVPRYLPADSSVFIVGSVDQPGLIGIAPLERPTAVFLGWRTQPRALAVFNESLIYIGDDAQLHRWAPTPLVSPFETPDAGDGGAADGGRDAGGLDAGGLDASYAFPRFPESDHTLIPTRCAAFGVQRLFTGKGEVWAQCNTLLNGGADLFRLGSVPELGILMSPLEVPLSVSGLAVLAQVPFDAGFMMDGGALDAGLWPDGGFPLDRSLHVKQGGAFVRVPQSENRLFGTPRARELGFDVITFDPRRARCARARIEVGGQMSETAAPELPNDGGCLAARFLPNSLDVLLPGTAEDGGFYFFVYQTAPEPDAGLGPGPLPDPDAGEEDAGFFEPGLDGGFEFGRETTSLRPPPVLSIKPADVPFDVVVRP